MGLQYHISDKMKPLKPSAIREIFKYAADPSVISLAAGSPNPDAIPVEMTQRFLSDIMKEEPMLALQYSVSEGHPPLREALRSYLREKHDSYKDFDDVIVVSGAQQCMDLACKVLCNEGDTVICEGPSFVGSLNTFRSYGVNLVGVPMEEDGIHIEKLEQALKENLNTRLLYLIPNFQNPTGITMSLAKRRAVYTLAKQYGVMILEDNPYGDLRFEGENIPTIKSLDEDGLVLYAGTFSKILSPGIRVGYLVAPTGIMSNMVVSKQCTDVHTGMFGQLLCLRFLTQCDIEEHLGRISVIYRHKCGLMLRELETYFPGNVRFTRPQGGLFIWATLPEGMDGKAFTDQLVQEKRVCVVPGIAFSPDTNSKSNAFRMNFSTPSDENITEGVRRIGELLKTVC